MKKSAIRPIIGGVLLGTVVFFTGPLLLIVLLLKFIFTPFGMGRMMMHRKFAAGQMCFNPDLRFAFAEKIRGMKDGEFKLLKENMQNPLSGQCGKQN